MRYLCVMLLSSVFAGCCCGTCNTEKPSSEVPAGPSDKTARDPEGATGSEARPPESSKTDPKK
ncbi:MAG: hypothetical protein HUU29_14350 [Planctomycetaceae bacterium]|nr:hypothetical protein [Planctomycetaceae bacterium]